MKPEITTNGITVWVNNPICVGRFCRLSGEIFLGDQSISTKPEWASWRKEMKVRVGVNVPEKFRPRWSCHEI